MIQLDDKAPGYNVNRRLSMLRTLRYMNATGDFPTATELVRGSDSRETVPRTTLHTRRVMIRDMRQRGFITTVEIPSSRFDHLKITEEGISFIQQYREAKWK